MSRFEGRRVFRLFARVDGAREKRAGFLASYPFRSEERKRRFIRSPRVDRLRQKKARFSGSPVAPATSESFKKSVGGRGSSPEKSRFLPLFRVMPRSWTAPPKEGGICVVQIRAAGNFGNVRIYFCRPASEGTAGKSCPSAFSAQR